MTIDYGLTTKGLSMKDKKQKHICPMCKKETTWDGNPFRPFCSERCRLIDLGKWAAEEYRLADKKQDMPDNGDKDRNKKNQTEE